MDNIDAKILNYIQDNPEISNVELARKLKLAASGVLERVKKLKALGVIEKYEIKINPEKVNLKLMTFIHVETNEPIGHSKIGQELAKIQAIQEVHLLAGEYCYLIKARVLDSKAHNLLLKEMGKIKGVKNAKTTMVLETIKESLNLDLGNI